VLARPHAQGAWTVSPLAAPPVPFGQAPGQDDWVVTNVAQAVRVIEAEDEEVESEMLIEEGTPVEGVVAVAPPLPMVETTFVAGEIDVPTPLPPVEIDPDVPGVEFTAASAILGQPEPPDPDTGSRTPPLERR
jgi:hypothetical protein